MSEVAAEKLAQVKAYLKAYMDFKEQVDRFTALAEESREAVKALLGQEKPGTTWRFADLATVTITRGRVSEKLDRSKLAKAGVAAEVLDAATVRTEGAPSLRISAPEPEAVAQADGAGV